MRALIVDDERLARVELRRLLAEHADVEVVGEAENAAAALRAVARYEPVLLFLDIQMPGESGFDLVARLPPPAPRIVFTTAYDAHALRAFEVNALDYLLKPIDPTRLATALERARAAVEDPGDEPTVPLTEGDRVYLRDGERSWFVPVADIRLLESVGNYTRVFFGAQRPLVRRTLNALDARLPPSTFFRANRAQMINLRWVERVDEWLAGGLRVALRATDEVVEISRRRAAEFRRRASL